MTTQQVLQRMTGEVKQLNDAISGKALRDMQRRLAQLEIEYRRLKLQYDNQTAFLDECETLAPGIVCEAAVTVYWRMRNDPT